MPLNELGAPRLELVETLVQFLSLGRSERYIARPTPKRIPQVSDEAQALFGLKCVDIYGWHAHVVMIPPRSDNRVAVVRLTCLRFTSGAAFAPLSSKDTFARPRRLSGSAC
jgi:hypothetical protein